MWNMFLCFEHTRVDDDGTGFNVNNNVTPASFYNLLYYIKSITLTLKHDADKMSTFSVNTRDNGRMKTNEDSESSILCI